ncbi:unnamed protein product [Brassica oleracea var. botrytis]
MSRYAQENIVESYFTSVRADAELFYPSLEVTLRTFTRVINRQEGYPDVFIHQTVHPNPMDFHQAFLASACMMSQERLASEIQLVPPRVTQASLPYMRLRDNRRDWSNFAENISSFGYGYCSTAILQSPFRLKAEQAYGTIFIGTQSRDWDFWKEVPWRTRGNGFLNDQCFTCCQLMDIESEYDNLAGFICGHLFHKRCIKESMWKNASPSGETRCYVCKTYPMA